jgi:hypothetical protein
VAAEARVDEAGGRVGQQAEATERGLALDAGGKIIRERDRFEGGTQDELTGVQDEALGRVDLDEPGQSGWSCAGSMTGYLWLSKSRKNLSSRTSTLLGWTIAGSQGSRTTRFAAISARMSRSERSTPSG